MEGNGSKTRLIEAATEEFLAHGFEKANVGRIATAAGISKKTVYRHFDSKEDLLHAALQASMVATFTVIGPFDVDMHPRERIAAHLDAFAALAFSPKGITSYRFFMSEGMRFKDLAQLYIDAVTLFGIQPLARDLQAYVVADRLSLDDPVLAARMLMAMVFAEPMRDAGLRIVNAPTVEETRKLVDTAVTLFLKGARRTGDAR